MPPTRHDTGTRVGTVTIGLGLPDFWRLADGPKDYTDFTQLYTRWLDGPLPLNPYADDEEQRRVQALNWRTFGKAEPTLTDLMRLGWYPNSHPGPVGMWRVARMDYSDMPEELRTDAHYLNEVWGPTVRPEEIAERTLSELWALNVVVDNGATAMLKNAFNSAGSTIAIYNHMGMDWGNFGYASQTGAAINNASGAQTTITCGGGVQVANLPVSSAVTWSYGTSNAETWTTGSSAPGNLGATTITVVSQTTVSGHTHSAGDWVVLQPTTSDNPASVSNSTDSGALSAGAFTFSGTGAGNRQVVISFAFPASPTTPAGAYTSVYMGNAATIANNTTGQHLIIPPQTVNTNGGVTMNSTIKL